MAREHVVAAVISAAGGLTGRVRLQKIIYLLDQLGLDSGFQYEYHHYGPYADDIVSATEDAKAFELVEEEIGYRRSDGMRYSIFNLHENRDIPDEAFGNLGRERANEMAGGLSAKNSTVLELAATIHWLYESEGIQDWRAELIRRKGRKTEEGRLEMAIQVLRELGLLPPEEGVQLAS